MKCAVSVLAAHRDVISYNLMRTPASDIELAQIICNKCEWMRSKKKNQIVYTAVA